MTFNYIYTLQFRHSVSALACSGVPWYKCKMWHYSECNDGIMEYSATNIKTITVSGGLASPCHRCCCCCVCYVACGGLCGPDGSVWTRQVYWGTSRVWVGPDGSARDQTGLWELDGSLWGTRRVCVGPDRSVWTRRVCEQPFSGLWGTSRVCEGPAGSVWDQTGLSGTRRVYEGPDGSVSIIDRLA